MLILFIFVRMASTSLVDDINLMLMLQWECGQQETVSALTFKHIQAGSEMYTHFQSISALAEQ